MNLFSSCLQLWIGFDHCWCWHGCKHIWGKNYSYRKMQSTSRVATKPLSIVGAHTDVNTSEARSDHILDTQVTTNLSNVSLWTDQPCWAANNLIDLEFSSSNYFYTSKVDNINCACQPFFSRLLRFFYRVGIKIPTVKIPMIILNTN